MLVLLSYIYFQTRLTIGRIVFQWFSVNQVSESLGTESFDPLSVFVSRYMNQCYGTFKLFSGDTSMAPRIGVSVFVNADLCK